MHLVHIRMMWLKVVVLGRHCQVLGVWRGKGKVRGERGPCRLLRLKVVRVLLLRCKGSVLRHSSMMLGLWDGEDRGLN